MPPIDFQTYWGIFPLGIAISTLAMLTGIDGAAFWGPALLLLYGVDPAVAVACGIFIEVFGFGSGVYGYARRGKILFRYALPFLVVAVPFGLAGAYISKTLSPTAIAAAIGIGCLFLAYRNFERARLSIQETAPDSLHIENKSAGYLLSGIGGFFTGVIGFGLGETNNYYLLIKNRFPATYATGTTVFMIALTAFAASLFNVFYFKQAAQLDLTRIYSIVVFAVPAVLIGGQLGVRLAHIICRPVLHYVLVAVFILMAVMSFTRTFR
ncbi:MAG: sulfite exporter TauE/SafE family protein [Nitrospirae bacterium]|nr:MAG: sulfite exporter TauE/SafE family protein [Nitrospirota bacterium]